MPQIFHRSTNTIAKISLLALLLILILFGYIGGEIFRSSYVTQARVIQEQPVPFSHKHHVQQLGIDCRYCHTSVEDSAFAGIPPTQTCMNCHSQIWADSPMLEPVRRSYQTETSIRWTRVHDLPDFVYFDHSIHVKKGIGCTSCHGRVDEMPLVWRQQPLHMDWCLDCHRNPEKYVRPREQVFSMDWTPDVDQLSLGNRLVEEYDIGNNLTNCSVCHR